MMLNWWSRQKQVVAADWMVMPRSCFLLHEVDGGGAVVDLAHFVDLAGEFENALGGRRFARIDVGENADVAVFGEVLHA